MASKGQKLRHHSLDFKVKIVKLHLYGGQSLKYLAASFGLDHGLIGVWVRRYIKDGEDGLKPKPKGRPKNPLGPKRYFSSELERLQYENAKLKLEILQLKKLQSYLRGDAKSAKRS